MPERSLLRCVALWSFLSVAAAGCYDAVDGARAVHERESEAALTLRAQPTTALYASGSRKAYTLPDGLTADAALSERGLDTFGFTVVDTPLYNFGEFEDIDDTTTYPERTAVRLHVPDDPETFEEDAGVCSGMLIDDALVLTAAHCVHTGGPNGHWLPLPQIIPAADGPVGATTAPYGTVRAVDAAIPPTWTEADVRQDVALLFLDRPIGILTGWAGYTAPTCESLQTLEHTSHAFPNIAGFDGSMQSFSGNFYDCPNAYVAEMYTPIFKGASGGGVYRLVDDLPRAVGAWSFTAIEDDGGAFIATYMARITPWFSDFISQTRLALREPDETDLTPLIVRTDTGEVVPDVSGALEGVRFVLYNQGGAAFDGQVDADFYLLPYQWTQGGLVDPDAAGPSLTEVGLYLGTYSFDAQLAAQEGTFIHVPDGSVTVPPAVFDWPYYDAGFTQLSLGVYLDVDDDRPENNDGVTNDSGWHDRDTLSVLQARPDLAFVEVTHATTDAAFGLTGPLAVTLEVANLGPGVADPWHASFFLMPQPEFVHGIELIPLGQGTAAPIPGFGGFYDAFFVPLPEDLEGTWYLWISLQAAGDSEPGNNDYFSPEPIELGAAPDGLAAAPPDLDITVLTAGNAVYEASDLLPVTIHVTNLGGSSATDWHVEFYAVRNALTLDSPVFLGQGVGAAAIAAGATSAWMTSLPLDDLGGGAWYLLAQVECPTEAASGNNHGVAPGGFTMEYGLLDEGPDEVGPQGGLVFRTPRQVLTGRAPIH